MNVYAFLITLLTGISFFIGYLITKIIKDEKKLVIFAVGFAFSIILGLCLFDMLPECLEMENKLVMIISMIGGIGVLKVLDIFIPDHEHHKKDEAHIEHIGIISTLALFLHNIIEGSAIYMASINDIKVGLFMALGVSFHNIPLGIQTSSLVHKNKQRFLLLSLLALSSVIGIVFINVFSINISELISQILICVSFGMLIYISLFELLCEVKENIKKKELVYGIILGIVFILIGHFIG